MLIEAADLRELFDIADQIVDGRLTFCIRNASRTLKGWVGDEVYEDAAAEEPEDPENADRAAALKDAESYLAMYHALLNTSVRIRKSGLVSREQDAAGPMGGTVVNQYFNPKELAQLRDEYLAQAKTIAGPYLDEVDQKASLGAGTFLLKGGWASSEEEADL
jgi:hypothetical protein